MKTIKIIIISLLVGLNLTSCDFLEKDPTYTTPENFFKNEADATSWLTGTYAILGQSSFYGNEFLYLVGGDDLGHYGGANRGPNKSGLICNNANTSDPAVAALWYTLYSGINRANIFLENIDAVPDMNDDTRKQYKAEARFLRAFYYFTLVECWGDVPFKTTSTEDAYNLSIPRTDKQTIYDFIIKEMYGSAEDLKSAQDLNYLPGRVSKSAAWGMLARVYMFRAGEPKRDKEVGLANNTTSAEITEYFKKASYYAQLVKNEGHSLTAKYWDFFIDICSDKYNTALNKDGAKANESIWEVEFAGNRSTDVRAEGRIGNIIGIQGKDLSSKASITGKGDPGYAYAFIWNTPKLLELYEANGDIDRCNWNIAPFTYTQSAGEGTPVDGREFVKGKRDEVNHGPNDLAYECINAVRERAGINKLAANLDETGFRKAIKDERAMELCFEYTRRFDLIRWGDYHKLMQEQVDKAQADESWKFGINVYTYFNIPKSYNYFPIPANEIGSNGAIKTNNPGW